MKRPPNFKQLWKRTARYRLIIFTIIGIVSLALDLVYHYWWSSRLSDYSLFPVFEAIFHLGETE